MQSDGSVIIDTKILDGGLEKGFEAMRDEMETVGVTAEKTGEKIKLSFSRMDISKPIAAAADRVKDLETQMERVTAEAREAKLGDDDSAAMRLENQRIKLYDQLEQARRKLEREIVAAAQKEATVEAKEAARATKAKKRELEKQSKAAQKEAERQRQAALRPVQRFGSRFREILSGALIFNALSAGLRAMTQYFGAALKSNQQFTASFAKLKGALLTAFQPIYEVVVPALLTLMNILTRVVQAIGHIFSILGGKSDKQMADNAKALNKQTKAISGTGSAAKKAAKQLASFDEINKISATNKSESGGGGAGGTINPDFSEFNTEEYKNKIDDLTTYVSMALLGLGAILTFSGANIPLGIALMALGAVGLASVIKTNWDAVKNALSGSIGDVIAIVSGALLVIGAILAFSGVNIGMGIGLMLAGAVGLGTTVAANWDTMKEKLQGPMGAVTAIASAALLAIGAILAFSGVNIGMGIGLMLAGAVGLGTTVAANWDTMKEKLQGPMGAVTAIASAALLAIGAILAFSGASLPLGIGMMAAGAIGLTATAALNWDIVKQKITSVVSGLLAIISSAGLVLGVLLCLSGAGIGLGLALIFAGIAGNVAAWNIDDNPITRFIKNIANGIIAIVNKVIAAINSIFDISFKGMKLGGVQVIPAFSAKLVNIPKIPALAQGAVLPPNKPFMAMVGDQRHGTNIEAPLSTIQEAVALVMEDYAAANLAGHEATVAVLRDILEAVLGIEIGDDVLGKAANRYNARLATMRGDG